MTAKKKAATTVEKAVKPTEVAPVAEVIETASKKPAAKPKTPRKKAAPKKTEAKKAEVKKAEVKKTDEPKAAETPKKNMQDYKDVINWKKWEAHNMDWLYIEINAGDLMTELEAGVNNIENCCNAIKECMLEGDEFITEPKDAGKIGTVLTVRYYCDNLSEERRKYFM